jgi:hypothetical protein
MMEIQRMTFGGLRMWMRAATVAATNQDAVDAVDVQLSELITERGHHD